MADRHLFLDLLIAAAKKSRSALNDDLCNVFVECILQTFSIMYFPIWNQSASVAVLPIYTPAGPNDVQLDT